jgi:hypothetical protein
MKPASLADRAAFTRRITVMSVSVAAILVAGVHG